MGWMVKPPDAGVSDKIQQHVLVEQDLIIKL